MTHEDRIEIGKTHARRAAKTRFHREIVRLWGSVSECARWAGVHQSQVSKWIRRSKGKTRTHEWMGRVLDHVNSGGAYGK